MHSVLDKQAKDKKRPCGKHGKRHEAPLEGRMNGMVESVIQSFKGSLEV